MEAKKIYTFYLPNGAIFKYAEQTVVEPKSEVIDLTKEDEVIDLTKEDEVIDLTKKDEVKELKEREVPNPKRDNKSDLTMESEDEAGSPRCLTPSMEQEYQEYRRNANKPKSRIFVESPYASPYFDY